MPEAMALDPVETTGISGLDNVLGGGLTRNRLYLLEGNPGTGKTTVALQFLMEGARIGQKSLYVSMSETKEEVEATARSHGWDISNIEIHEMVSADEMLESDQRQSLLYSADLELGEATKAIFRKVEEAQPDRFVIDSLSEFQLLAQGSVRYRRQLLSLKHFLARKRATVLFLDDMTADTKDRTIHSIAHGVIQLQELAPDYGAERRRLRIIKYRGMAFRGGYHDFAIKRGGIVVYPRLIAAEHKRAPATDLLLSGIPGLDAMLGGGLDRASSLLLTGPSGAGKTLLSLQYAHAALARGEKVAAYVFDEDIEALLRRARTIGMDFSAALSEGRFILEPVDAAELTPGEFTYEVRDRVENDSVTTIIIDSLNGYQKAMPEEQFLQLHMHELLVYLSRQNATAILTLAQSAPSDNVKSDAAITMVSDTIVLLRFFESQGEVLKAISVLKKRAGFHESTIRELKIQESGVHVGAVMTQFSGVLDGIPVYIGAQDELLKS